MQKWIRRIPLGLCVLYGFYPLMLLLGGKLKFGYELHSPELSSALTAMISIASLFLLRREKTAYSRIDRIALVAMLPLCCIHSLNMYVEMDSIFTSVMTALSFIACCVLFFTQGSRKWYVTLLACIVLFPLLVFTSLALLMAPLFMDFGYTELLRSYEKDGYVCYDYHVDDGALGEDWYTDVYSKESYPLIFGTFYPYYERIISR